MKQSILFLCCILPAHFAFAQSPIAVQPYLQNPSENGITVMWRTSEPACAWVEYGTDTTRLNVARVVENGIVLANVTKHKVRIDGLIPNQKYYYRVCSQKALVFGGYDKKFDKTVKSSFRLFTTPGKHGKDFTCVIFNDLHSNLPLFDKLVKQLKNVRHDFAVFNGDCFNDPSSEEHELGLLMHYNAAMNASNVPVFYLRGNHEIRGVYALGWPGLFDWANNKPYSSFSFGDTRFVLLDNGEDKNDGHVEYFNLTDFSDFREKETAWLQSEVISPEFKNANRKILIQHIPIYAWENIYDPGFIPGKELFDPIYQRTRFDINITGHLHQFGFYPVGKSGNPFPLVIGGGNKDENATVMILRKRGDNLTLEVLDVQGKSQTFIL